MPVLLTNSPLCLQKKKEERERTKYRQKENQTQMISETVPEPHSPNR